MNTKYQLVVIGSSNPLQDLIIDTFKNRVSDLGININSISILIADNFHANYITNSPTTCIYFGSKDNTHQNIDILETLISDSKLVLPVVDDLANFTKHTPTILHPINGFKLKDKNNVEALVGRILEGLGLLRLSRRLFISYKRSESTGVAIQLFEKLEQSGFDVFLDTHTILPGEIFQDELWHRLVDADIVVLLNTPGFLESKWTREELAKASAKSIGILQVIWPTHKPENSSLLSIPVPLKVNDFENNHYNDLNGKLVDAVLINIVNQAESLRARSLGARQDNIISEFMRSAKSLNVVAFLQPEKFITVKNKAGDKIIIIPTIGVPHAFTYHQSEDLIKAIKEDKTQKIFLLYDHINIREKWLKHLAWLDEYLPVNSIKTVEIETWLKTLNQ
ncbi:MAG TPA: toll/interleukin-1 receptor domain-containing protein [Bacteroidia bacterium]|jgi:hypothetical protein|nr:toll/interleukin-1 receptor domain-containing protein [Bacteroidia bacterium]